MTNRCDWVTDDPLYIAYHDDDWGVPIRRDDIKLFEMLILEGAQAGLSWITILKRREGYREAFDGFDPAIVAVYDEEKITALLQNPKIIRNKLKVRGAVKNAQAFLHVQEEFSSFSAYLWRFVDGQPIQNAWQSLAEVPAETARSGKLSKDLKKRGFTFVGPTICYAFMQATGMVNDHTTDCDRYEIVKNLSK